MGLFFHDSQQGQKQFGIQHWREQAVPSQPPILSFSLRQVNRSGAEVEHQVMMNDEQMYIKHTSSTIKRLPLCLTAMEESFYLMNNRKVYALKFIRKQFTTLLFTYNEEIFIQCYCFLAKYCILRNFERHFKVGKKIGQGSFAAVYEGINIRSSEKVALKVFNKSKFQNGDDISLSMLFNEIDKLERLRRYNLSPLIEVYEAQDCIILVMQKAEAGDMVSYLQLENLHYDGNLIRTIMQQILQSLCILHNAGFIHRDIKPENVLFLTKSRKSGIFLSDFGLTVNKNSELESRVGRMDAGTIGFAAPQILHNKNYDQKCDMFSAGCLFYFLNTGLNFFESCNYKEIRNRTEDSYFIKNRIEETENLTESTRNLLQKLLQVDPSLRMSAEQALNHEYFESREYLCTHPGCDDETFRQYIEEKINKFWQ